MVRTRAPNLWQFLGSNIQGDLAGWTLYIDRYKRLIAYPSAPPLAPPSPNQRANCNADEVW